ncbi:MAG: zinc-ribbon domain-containing protein [Polyangiaceae bacterium]
MKITCQACQAKYTIADEKVVGKIVKIRCKKCGATIVVNGSDATASGGTLPPQTANAFDYAAQGTVATPWMVNVADGDQRTMSEQEVAAAYRAGVVTDDTLCWKEGQQDWLPIHEISPLQAACTAARQAREEEYVANSNDGNAEPSRGAASLIGRPAKKEGNGVAVGASAGSAVAARRAGGRAAAADLFGSVAQAGGEDEVLTSAPAGTTPQKGGVAQAPSMTATNEASGLIDIRQLGAQMRSTGDEKKKSRVDDIMNLGGGGAFSPSLAAPVLAAPSLEHYSEPPPSLLGGPGAAQVKSKALIFLALGAGTFFLVAAVAIAVMLVRGKSFVASEEVDKTKTSASGTAAAQSPGMSVAMNSAAAAPQPSVAPEAASATAAQPPPPPPPAAPVAQEAPRGAQEAPRKEFKEYKAPPAAPKEAPAASGAEFNLGEARSRLAAIVGGLQSCKRADTTGSGKVEIVFAPSGGVQSAALMAGSPFEGTPTGKCVEARFRQARVPAFGGSPVPVTKSFSIN